MQIEARHVEEDDIERLLDVKQVADRLGVSDKTVWVMSGDGRFPPPLRLGRLTRWRVADFNHWVEQHAERQQLQPARKGRKR
jgi:predicted DNA-binding transcriptional regulator AlpA